MKLAIALICSWCSMATAEPMLGKAISDGISVAIPAHWVLTVDAAAGSVVAREDPTRKDAAQLTVAIKQAKPDTREAALLQAMLGIAQDVKLLAHDALPGGKGQAMVAEGTIDGIRAKLGAIAIVADGRAAVGLLVATPGEFNTLGGLQLLLASLQSLHAVGGSELEIENTFDRGNKRRNQPDLDPARPAVPRDQLINKSWAHSVVSSTFIEQYRTNNTAYGHNDGYGNTEGYTFAGDGTYKLQVLMKLETGGCNSQSWGVETGTYTTNGKELNVAPKHATFTASICSGKTSTEPSKLTPPRHYQIAMSRDGRLIFVGPGCTGFPDAGCADHVRWEMTVLPPVGK